MNSTPGRHRPPGSRARAGPWPQAAAALQKDSAKPCAKRPAERRARYEGDRSCEDHGEGPAVCADWPTARSAAVRMGHQDQPRQIQLFHQRQAVRRICRREEGDIIHGYEQDASKEVIITGILNENELIIIVKDEGVGIENVAEALRVNYSSKNRSGLGLTIIKSLCDDIQIKTKKDYGTKLIIKKVLTIKGN